MKETYLFDYVNENEFKKLERSLKKDKMLAYKKLYFEYYPSLKNGNFLGKLISTNKTNGTQTYELKLPTDALFSKVHGDIKLYYLVYEKEKIVMLDKLEPVDILTNLSDFSFSTLRNSLYLSSLVRFFFAHVFSI